MTPNIALSNGEPTYALFEMDGSLVNERLSQSQMKRLKIS